MRRVGKLREGVRKIRDLCVERVYATHNRSKTIEKAIAACLGGMGERGLGLNVGAGRSRLHARVLNLDIAPTEELDVCGNAEALPFKDGSFAVVLTQETLEHVRDPELALAEIRRVLHEQGVFYCQVPFVIGYHPGPADFQRWTREGIVELLRRCGFNCFEVGISVGPATGCYRIAVEFWAVVMSSFWPRLYLPVKGLLALLLFPVKLLDPLMLRSPQADRIAGGYYVVARKACPTSTASTS